MKTFKQYINEMLGVAPANTVGGGSIAGTGGLGGEPGVDLRKKKKNDPRMPMGLEKRKNPK